MPGLLVYARRRLRPAIRGRQTRSFSTPPGSMLDISLAPNPGDTLASSPLLIFFHSSFIGCLLQSRQSVTLLEKSSNTRPGSRPDDGLSTAVSAGRDHLGWSNPVYDGRTGTY